MFRGSVTALAFICCTVVAFAAPPKEAGRVTPLGETLERLQRAYDRLNAPPLSDEEFVLSDLHFHRKRRFTEYSGDISGRMLNALTTAGEMLNRESPLVPKLLKACIELQKPDGHYGVDQDLAREVSQARDMPIMWGNGRILLAMAEYLERHPNAELLAAAKRLGDYLISTRPYCGKRENFERVGGAYASGFTTCYPSLIDGLAALYRVSGDTRYLMEAMFIADLSLLDAGFEKHHSHGRLTAYRGMIDAAAMLGTIKLPASADRKTLFVLQFSVPEGCDRVMKDFVLPTGGITETFDLTDVRDEACADSDWVRVNYLLGRFDIAEHGLRNHLLAMQFRNGGFGHHTFRKLVVGSKEFPGGGVSNVGAEAYWCCSMHATQLLAELPRWGVVVKDNEVNVTWLAEVRSEFKAADAAFEVRRTDHDHWTVKASYRGDKRMPLRLRVPNWATVMRVNDQKVKASNGFYVFQPAAPEVTLNVSFTRSIREAGVYGHPVVAGEPVRLFNGPDLLCLPDVQLPRAAQSETQVPHIVLSTDATTGEAVDAVMELAAGKTCRVKLIPISRRPLGGARFLFLVRNETPEKFSRLLEAADPIPTPGLPVEIITACAGEGTLHLNGGPIGTFKGAGESPIREFYLPPGDNLLQVVATTTAAKPGFIGLVRGPSGFLTLSSTKTWQAAAGSAPRKRERPAPQPAGASLPLRDIGEFGIAPWHHISAEFAGTNARWIWPEVKATTQPSTYVLQTTLHVE